MKNPQSIKETVSALTPEERTFIPESLKELMLEDIRSREWSGEGFDNDETCAATLEAVIKSDELELLEPVVTQNSFGHVAFDEFKERCPAPAPHVTIYSDGAYRGVGVYGFRLYQPWKDDYILGYEQQAQDLYLTTTGVRREGPLVPGSYLQFGSYFSIIGLVYVKDGMESSGRPLCFVSNISDRIDSGLSSSYAQWDYFAGAGEFQEYALLRDTNDEAAYLTKFLKSARAATFSPEKKWDRTPAGKPYLGIIKIVKPTKEGRRPSATTSKECQYSQKTNRLGD
jgi:hypothetical protein